MATTDGKVIGTTQIVNHGPTSSRWNLVVMPDGYRQVELDRFATDAQQFVATLFATKPFDKLQGAINVFRVDVSSKQSGADDPKACGGTGAKVATFFDASFCNNGIQRLLVVNTATAIDVAKKQVPQYHMVMVIVNSTVYGGSGGSVAVFSKAPGAMNVALHEMGHTAFGLADEYEYFQGCSSGETTQNVYAGGEPLEPNVTIEKDRTKIKWRALIKSATSVPTKRNADCSKCDPQPSPVPVGTLGAFEGARYFHCGVFRGEFNCRMRDINAPFCGVCQNRIRTVLAPFSH
jgi:hypothetical protein